MAGKSQEQSIQEELTCSICYDLFRNPVMLECMHHFCKECIQKYWNGCPRIATCPLCLQKFPSRSFHSNFIVSNIVETVRRSASEEHRRKTKMELQKVLQAYQRKCEKLLEMKQKNEKNANYLVDPLNWCWVVGMMFEGQQAQEQRAHTQLTGGEVEHPNTGSSAGKATAYFYRADTGSHCGSAS